MHQVVRWHCRSARACRISWSPRAVWRRSFCRLWQWRRNSALRDLLEGIAEFDEPRLTASHTCETYAEWAGLGIEVFGKWRKRCVRHHPERNDDGGVSWFCCNRRAAGTREKERVQAIGFHHLVDAVCRRQRDVFGAIRFITRPVRFNIHFIGVVQVRLAVFDRTGFLMLQVPLPQIGQGFYGCRWTESREPAIEIAFHAVFRNDGTTGIAALAISRSGTDIPLVDVPVRIGIDNARDICGIDNDDTLFLQNVNRIGHGFDLIRIEPVVKRDARDPDASSFQAVTLEEPGIVAARRRHAGPGCWIIR